MCEYIIILASLGRKLIKTAYGLIQLIGLARPKFDVLLQADDFDLTQVDPNYSLFRLMKCCRFGLGLRVPFDKVIGKK